MMTTTKRSGFVSVCVCTHVYTLVMCFRFVFRQQRFKRKIFSVSNLFMNYCISQRFYFNAKQLALVLM